MSASYDKPDRPVLRGLDQPQRTQDYDIYDDGPVTQGGRTGSHVYDRVFDPDAMTADTTLRSEFERPAPPEAYATARGSARKSPSLTAPIVPAGSVTGRSLTLVITIMCFLACLTVGAVYMIRQSANAWQKDIASEVTVQVVPKDGTDNEKIVQDVAAYLNQQAGISTVRVLSPAESAALLEPWLGAVEDLSALPLPRLIAIELERSGTPDIDVIRSGLAAQFDGATLDDHRRWQAQIATITNSFSLGGLAILALVAMATTAIIVSATKSSMASNREIVEVLHFVGANDRFIAREFEKHFLRLGVRAGLVGATLALLVFLTMPTIIQILGGGAMTLTELHRLVGSGSLDLAGFVLLGIVVVVVAAICMLTSRFGVFRILNSRQ
jgi:cell division transport system permease protein